MLDVALDMIIMVIEQQIRILSGAAASDPAESGLPMRRIRRRHRKTRTADEKSDKMSGGLNEQGKVISKFKGRGKARSKKSRLETGAAGPVEIHEEQCKPDDVESNVLTLVSVGYETVSSGLNTTGTL